MNTTKTISVEPAKITLAELKNKEKAAQFLRASILQKENQKTEKISLVNIFFPTKQMANEALVKFSVPLRTIFSAILIISGLSFFENSNYLISSYSCVAILEIIFGVFLAIGLLSRIVMAASSIMFVLCGIISLRSGYSDITAFALMFGSVLFFIMGAGKYSCDTLIRRNIKKFLVNKKRKAQEERLSYKAFSYVTKNI